MYQNLQDQPPFVSLLSLVSVLSSLLSLPIQSQYLPLGSLFPFPYRHPAKSPYLSRGPLPLTLTSSAGSWGAFRLHSTASAVQIKILLRVCTHGHISQQAQPRPDTYRVHDSPLPSPSPPPHTPDTQLGQYVLGTRSLLASIHHPLSRPPSVSLSPLGSRLRRRPSRASTGNRLSRMTGFNSDPSIICGSRMAYCLYPTRSSSYHWHQQTSTVVPHHPLVDYRLHQ